MRRALAPALLVALALTLWAAGPALSTRPQLPKAVDFELAVDAGTSARAAAASTRATGPVLKAPKRFDLLGLRWTSPEAVDIELRVRKSGGGWSRWVDAPNGDADGPDRGAVMHATNPIWAGGADELQLRTDRRVRGLKVHFVNTTGTATATDRAATAARTAVRSAVAAVVRPFATALAQAQAQSGPPAMVDRASWGADQCPPRDTPSYGTVSMAYVHHTVSINDYSAAQGPSIVLGICRYHRNSNGWDDIGYNFLVDKYGTLYEGRAGGIDQPVIGAQAQGWNSKSTSVSNIGTYTSTPASAAAMDAMKRLLAWKLPLHGVPVTGKVTLASGGGAQNKYKYGANATFDRISGHRDGGQTSCPGDRLYAQLPDLRRSTLAIAAPPTQVELTTRDRDLQYPAQVPLSGRVLAADGSPLPGLRIALERRGRKGGFATFQTVTSGADGSFSATVPTSIGRYYRASYAGDATRSPGVSDNVIVTVRPVLEVKRAASQVVTGGQAQLAGTIRPPKKKLQLVAERRSGSKWKRLVARTVVPKGGQFDVAVGLRRSGRYRFRIGFAGDADNGAVRTGNLEVRAVPAR
jgi:hypothetical protein